MSNPLHRLPGFGSWSDVVSRVQSPALQEFRNALIDAFYASPTKKQPDGSKIIEKNGYLLRLKVKKWSDGRVVISIAEESIRAVNACYDKARMAEQPAACADGFCSQLQAERTQTSPIQGCSRA